MNQKASLKQFSRLIFVWGVVCIMLRCVELAYSIYLQNLPSPLLGISIKAISYDFAFFFKSTLLLFIIHTIFYLVSAKTAKITFVVTVMLLTLIHLGLMQYFFTSLVPLGADVYNYTFKDIQQTVGASGGIPIIGIIIIIFTEILVFLLFRLEKRMPSNLIFSVAIILISTATLAFELDDFIETPQFGNEYTNYLSFNKSLYFTNASLKLIQKTKDNEIDIYADGYLGIIDYAIGGEDKIQTVSYVNETAYPFLRRDSTADVLGPYFNKSTTKPNIVILIVEGLGKAFSGENAYLGSFTPFLDSLATKSLYWENHLSEGGRTFAVLPSILGSLPFAKSGFNEFGESMPPYISLVSILNKQGYKSAFHYGGNSSFDNMKLFLNRGSIGNIYDEATFGSGYVKMPSMTGFTWGYGDKELFRHYFDINNNPFQQPNLQVILTVSTHNPFLINDQELYLDKFQKRVAQLKLKDKDRKQMEKYNYMLGSVLYMDDAVKYFFETYSKRADFANTIFIITGDHRMPEIPMVTKIDRYHVPLIIYSPMLARTAKFSSISTHFDITPSLLAFLNKNHDIKRPSIGSWIGSAIDTARQFRNIHSYPIMMTKSEMVDYIMGANLLNNEDLYEITSTMGLKPIQDEAIKSRLKGSFEQFKIKNNKLVNGSKLVPDSLISIYNH